MKFIPIWYNQDAIVAQDPPIEAKDREDARNKAYMKHNGNPPAPILYLEEVN